MSLLDAEVIMLRNTQYGPTDRTEVGAMYELYREPRNLTNVKVTRPFTVSAMRAEWRTFAAEFVGETIMTHYGIELAGG
jgi:hypothetical protein